MRYREIIQEDARPQIQAQPAQDKAGSLTAFERWYAGSKLVDAAGKPLKLFHGTSKDQDFKSFKMNRNGVWFTTDSKSASDYAQDNDSKSIKYDWDTGKYNDVHTASRVIPAYVRATKIMHYDKWPDEIMRANNYKKAQGIVFDNLRAQGYDTVVCGNVIVAISNDPAQIKSAIGNTRFDSTKKNIDEEETITAWTEITALPEPTRSNALKAFDQLAQDQRGEPEDMGPGCGWEKNPGILHGSGIWLSLIEHVGDLTNRMSKGFHVTSQHCGYGYVASKTQMALRSLRNGYGCEREVKQQIQSNFDYQTEKKRFNGSFEDWQKTLQLAGKRYSNAHAKLTVYNEAQYHAKLAAMALGGFNFAKCERHLIELEKHLKDPKTWAEYAGLVQIDPDTQMPIRYLG